MIVDMSSLSAAKFAVCRLQTFKDQWVICKIISFSFYLVSFWLSSLTNLSQSSSKASQPDLHVQAALQTASVSQPYFSVRVTQQPILAPQTAPNMQATQYPALGPKQAPHVQATQQLA